MSNYLTARRICEWNSLLNVASELPYVDMEKKVMLGYSRGGLMTYLAIRKGINLRAAAVVSGVSDLVDTYDHREEDMKKIL
jgi:dipeptidyl aminopeptidase/acylaminoacyl peptidase